jgi:PAS domain S-box-containing protein
MNIEGLLRAALEASDEGIVATNAEWRVVLWNRGAARMFGWTAAEALGRPVYELHMRGVDPQELERYGTELRDGKGVRLSGLRVRKDGSTLHVESQITPMIDAAGSYVGALGTVRDITPLVESERALRLSEEKFAKAFHSSPYFTMISRLRDGRIVEANQDFEKLLGIPVAEAVGRMTVADLNMWADPEGPRAFRGTTLCRRAACAIFRLSLFRATASAGMSRSPPRPSSWPENRTSSARRAT